MSISSEFHLSTLHLQISTLTFQELSLPSRTDPAWLVEAIAEVRFVAHSDSLISMPWQELMKFKRKDWDLSEVWLFCHFAMLILSLSMVVTCLLKPFAAGVCDLQGRTSRRLP